MLEAIYQCYGYDFRNYAFPSIRRRIWHRIHLDKLSGIAELQEKILYDPEMMEKALSDFTINVSDMFRDPSFFHTFREKVIPQIKNKSQIKIWHAGCSTGEEVYSMAILLHEEGIYEKTKIFATDISLSNIRKAKERVFPLKKMQGFTKNYQKFKGRNTFSEYYIAREEVAEFHLALGENIVFFQHNLVSDTPFNQFDVIICRNVFIYLDKQLQNKVFQLLHDSLCMNGVLGIGNEESISFLRLAHSYKELDSNDKLFCKIK